MLKIVSLVVLAVAVHGSSMYGQEYQKVEAASYPEVEKSEYPMPYSNYQQAEKPSYKKMPEYGYEQAEKPTYKKTSEYGYQAAGGDYKQHAYAPMPYAPKPGIIFL